MNEKKYLTVKEVAEIAKVSPQSIYKRLNNQLNPYVKLVDNRKMLNIRVLSEVYGVEVEQPIQPKLNNSFNQENMSFIKLLEKQNQQLQESLNILNKQLSIKDKQIEELNNRLSESSDALVAAQETAKAAQMLHAGTIQQQIEIKKELECDESKSSHWWNNLFRKDKTTYKN